MTLPLRRGPKGLVNFRGWAMRCIGKNPKGIACDYSASKEGETDLRAPSVKALRALIKKEERGK